MGATNKIRVGIIGGAGYTGGELLRLLINHPNVEIVFVRSESNSGNAVSDVHSGLIGETDLHFTDGGSLEDIDLLFLCSGHGQSSAFWTENPRPAHLKVIDLAQDFRDESAGYVYGLPEVNRLRIANARSIANPGCFATAIQLALVPLAASKALKSEINITAITGSTGAGAKPTATTHFSWRNDNISIYKPFEHQHLAEIRRTLQSLDPDFNADINFVPVRGDFARGIFAIIYTDCSLSLDEAEKLYNSFYSDSSFTVISSKPIDLKQVTNTNKAIIHLEKHGSKLLITSAIDNLLKGATGQAVENMNIMFNLKSDTGLHLKSSAF